MNGGNSPQSTPGPLPGAEEQAMNNPLQGQNGTGLPCSSPPPLLPFSALPTLRVHISSISCHLIWLWWLLLFLVWQAVVQQARHLTWRGERATIHKAYTQPVPGPGTHIIEVYDGQY